MGSRAHPRVRAGADRFLKRHPDSPTPRDEQEDFEGLEYVPPNGSHRFELDHHELEEHDTATVETTRDGTGTLPPVGEVPVRGCGKGGHADRLQERAGRRPALDVELEPDDVDVVAREHLVDDTGDCVGEPMLETIAAKAGNHAVRNAFGDEGATIDYHSVPTVVFTSPEVAAVGTTEAEYVAEHETCTCRTIDVADVPKARVVEDTRGLVQVVKHHETDAVVGVHVVGPRAADVIPETTLAVKFGLTVDDVIDTVHPFPTFSEAFKHACQAFRRDVSRMSCCIE